jgi:hypothetical protein
MRLVKFAFLLLLTIAGNAQTKQLLKFENFPAHKKFDGKTATVKITSSRARMFRTMLRENAKEGADFAGHYKVAKWGCGSSCVSLAIINLKNGNVYFTPSLLWIGTPPMIWSSDNKPEDSIQYKVNSNLLIAVGARNDEGCGKYFYKWEDGNLKFIKSTKYAPCGN